MNKVLVKVFFPKINEQYEIWIPLNKKVYSVITLILKGINELHYDIYKFEKLPALYDRITGNQYQLDNYIQDTDIRNGSELIII